MNYWLYDFYYEAHGNKPYFIAWGLDKNGNPREFSWQLDPYFYTIENQFEEHKKEIKENELCMKTEQNHTRFLGNKQMQFAKIFTYLPMQVPDLAYECERFDMKTFERDIFFRNRCIIDLQIKPSSWFAKKSLEMADKTPIADYFSDKTVPKIEGLGFDFEVWNKRGAPDYRYDPLLLLSMKPFTIYPSELGNVEIEWHPTITEEASRDKDDSNIIEAFNDEVSKRMLIFGFNSNEFDMPYGVSRARVNGLPLNCGEKHMNIRQTSYGMYSIPGKIHYDTMGWCANYVPRDKQTIYISLKQSYQSLFGKTLMDFDPSKLWKYWKTEKWSTVRKYNRHHAIATAKIGLLKSFEQSTYLSRISSIPLMFIGEKGVSELAEATVMWHSFGRRMIIPNKVKHRYRYTKGAYTMSPAKHGVIEDVANLDLKSMYPSLMIRYNIGPDTFDENGKIEIPYVKHHFKTSPKSFIAEVLTNLKEVRAVAKDKTESDAIKLVMNATIGYFKYRGARFYSPEINESVTALGRWSLRKIIKFADKIGIEVIYGDTDSVFLPNSPKHIKVIQNYVARKLGLDIRVDKLFRFIFFTSAKKRYAYIDDKGNFGMVGIDAKRTDWCPLAGETQKTIINSIFDEGNASEAVELCKKIVSDIRQRKVPYKKLIITKKLGNDPDDYAVRTVLSVLGKRYHLKEGYPVSYVITDREGKLVDKAELASKATIDDIDIEYYIVKQILAVVMRILYWFKVDGREITSEMPVAITDV